ncbi:MAG: amino acid ABC transporter substrate-binding protein [Pararhodobacter sp.]|nr:amino acid ABC transporter substrate-binding protein [Pararhodobacter sp.]
MRKTLIAAIALVFGLGAGAADAQRQTLRVGAYPANPPWEFKNENNEFEGFEVDMITEIARRLDMDLEIGDYGFQALFAATASGRIDVAISTITITNERLQNQAFTQGYYDADLSLVTRQGRLEGLEDMRGQVIGAIAASTGERWINANTADYGFGNMVTHPTQQGLLMDVLAGRIAGAVGDVTGFVFAAQSMPDLHIAEVIPTGDRYGMMLPQGSALLEPINDAISAMKEDGTMAEIYERWLGAAPREGSSTVTVLPIPTEE